MDKVDLDILISSKLSFRQKWHYFKWPHPVFWLMLFRNKKWQEYVARNLKDGYLASDEWWKEWVPGVVDVKDGWVTFTGYEHCNGASF